MTLILFSVIDILGSVPVLIDLRKNNRVVFPGKATIVSGIIMLAFLYIGESILNLFGVDVPESIIKRLEQSEDQKGESKKICLELIQEFKEIQGVNGIHLMGHNKEQVIAEIIKESMKI